MQQELINKGIDPEHILLEEKSISTATELVEMVKMTVANNWSNITIITSDYHIPRTQAIFKNLEAIINYDDPEFRQAISEFHARNCEVSFVSAEEVLSNANPHYANLISKAHESEGYIKRAAAEKQGLKDLSEGRYRIHNLPTQK